MKRRIILLAPLLALFAFVATTEKRVEAADVATRVEAEKFATKLRVTALSVARDIPVVRPSSSPRTTPLPTP